MKILIVRHGQASPHRQSDADRFLTREGRDEVRRVAGRLDELRLRPTHLYVSPLVRAVQTAEILAHVAGLAGPVVAHPPLVPGGVTAHALSVLDAHVDEDVVGLVSHEPTVRVLAGHLTGQGGAFPAFPTAGVAVLEGDATAATLLGRLEPSTLSWRGA